MARVHLKSRLGLNAMSQWKGGSYYTRLRLSATGNIRWETGSRLNATSQDGTAPVILCHPSDLQRPYNFVLVHSGDEDILQRGLCTPAIFPPVKVAAAPGSRSSLPPLCGEPCIGKGASPL